MNFSTESNEEFSSDHRGPFEKSPEEKKLVNKINWTLLPFVGAIVFIQFIDKTTLSTSVMLNMLEDTHVSKDQYGWLGSVFYIGFIAFQIPNSYLLQKFRISRYLGTLLVLWGIVMCLTSLCTNFIQLAVCRVLLGLFEAGTYPSLLIIINSVYRRSEQSAAFGFLWLSNGSGTMVGSACSFGISHINHALGIASWKWPYIIWGALTIVFGFISFFFLPDTPTSFMFRLTEEEKEIVKERVQDNGVTRVYDFKKHHIYEALNEPRLWLICFSTLCNNLHTGGLVVFSTLLVEAFGFSKQHSILLQMPNGASTVLFSILAVVIARKTNQLYLGVAVSTTISLVGLILLVTLPEGTIKLVGFLLAWAMNGTAVMLLTITGANVAGYTKKLFYNGMNMIFYTLGNFIGPLLMFEREAPLYKTGMTVYCVANGAILIMLFLNRQYMARLNRIKLTNPNDEVSQASDDLTDRENKKFIYRL
ncbi:major facilitator superfamily domain-containing protein [Thamnidium elegans]|nr:major facilitator superfamily domain-containing protein [Thamnidium elegans]